MYKGFLTHDFTLEPEITMLLWGFNIQPLNVPISYNARSFDDGKKIKFKDFIEAIGVLIENRVLE